MKKQRKNLNKQFEVGETVGRGRDQKHLSSLRGEVIDITDFGNVVVRWNWNHPFIRENHPHLWDSEGNLTIWGRMSTCHVPAEIRKIV